MIDKKWKTAALCIYSETLPSSEITKILGQKPTRRGERGELLIPQNPDSKTREHSFWILESNVKDTQPLEKHLEKLLTFIASKRRKFCQLKDKCDMNITCALSMIGEQGSFGFHWEMLKQISDLQIDIIFDLYHEEEPVYPTKSLRRR